MTALRWLAFGDLDSAVWGLSWVHDEDGTGHTVLGAGATTRVVAAALDSSGPTREWRLSGEGVEVALSPVADAAGGLVRATGIIAAEGGERSVDAPGWRASVDEAPAAGELDSLRLVSAWFGDAEGLALLAVRPRKARGQEDDEITAALIESGAAGAVADARLSTTYSGDGIPARAGVELWVSEPVEDSEAASERPHRLAGELAGPPAAFADRGLEFTALPFRWHSHGQDGAGVYLLGRSG